MARILIIAPHPDDELLGCGGTLLRHIAEGDAVHWLIVTAMQTQHGYSPERIEQRARLLERVTEEVGFAARHELGLPTARLDTLPMGEIVTAIGNVVTQVAPHTLYVPHAHDVHTDHGVVATAARACSKWFRYPSVRRILAYETPSETDFALPPQGPGLTLNYYIDIGPFLERKLALLRLYEEELGDFPFPRSLRAVEALARVRGAASGCQAAEAFSLLKAIH